MQISTSRKPVKDNLSLCEEVNVIQIKVLNPADSNIHLEAGDDIVLVRLEKEASPEDPNFKTYSQIKDEALRSVTSDQSRETEEGEIKEDKTKRKKTSSMELETVSEEEKTSSDTELSLSDIESQGENIGIAVLVVEDLHFHRKYG